jgi:hypothetical protein
VIADRTLRTSLERLRLIKFFPANSPETLKEIVDMLCETFDRDRPLVAAVTAILRDPEWAEWRGAGAFYGALQSAASRRHQCDDELRKSIAFMEQSLEKDGSLDEFAAPPQTRKLGKKDLECARCSGCGKVVAAKFVGGPLLALAGLMANEVYEHCPNCVDTDNGARKAS